MSNPQSLHRTLTGTVIKYALIFGTAYTARFAPDIDTLQGLKDVWILSALPLNVSSVQLNATVANHTSAIAATSVTSLLNATTTSTDNVVPDIVINVALDMGGILGDFAIGYIEVILCSVSIGVFLFVSRFASRTQPTIDACRRAGFSCLSYIVSWIWAVVETVGMNTLCSCSPSHLCLP